MWSGSEKAILSAAGQLAFKTGDLLGPILDLVDLTDDVLLEAIGTLRNQGVTNPITAVLAATYSGIAGGNPLPASLVFVRTVPEFARSNIVAATAYRGKGEKGWGRLTIALHAANSETNSAILPDLIIDAWNAGGYGLRIDALQCAARVIAKVTNESAQKIAGFLEGLDVDNVFYNSYIYEALSTAGKFVSDQTIESITTEVLELTNSFDDPAARALAYSLYSRQYEDIDFGPIGESIDQLAPEVRVRFLIMVAYSADSIWAGSALRELSQELPSNSDVSDLFRFHLQTFPAKLGFPQDAAERYVTAIVGWAQTNTHLPPATEGASITEYERAWWLLGELILQAVRDEEQSVVEPIWESLHKISSEAVDALYRIAENPMLAYVRGWPGIDVFVDRNPDHVRRLALFGIQPPLTLRSESDFGPSGHWRKVRIKTLGRCGDAETIDLLKIYVDDPTFGPVAVESIRSISDR